MARSVAIPPTNPVNPQATDHIANAPAYNHRMLQRSTSTPTGI